MKICILLVIILLLNFASASPLGLIMKNFNRLSEVGGFAAKGFQKGAKGLQAASHSASGVDNVLPQVNKLVRVPKTGNKAGLIVNRVRVNPKIVHKVNKMNLWQQIKKAGEKIF